MTSTTDKTFSVTELNSVVRGMLETRLGFVKVRGEISNFSRPSSGHMYFTLKDDNAQIRCAFFRNRNIRLKKRPKNGQEIVASGQISLYEARGDYQMIIDNIEEAGEGQLQLEFERLKQKLFLEGLFDDSNKKRLPPYPKQIAVITSATGAAFQDVLHILRRRYPILKVQLYSVAVQGEESESQLLKALQLVQDNQRNDLILLIRGGGSIEDLWSFNSERLARAIATANLPVVTGIGHEIDFTIADFVADLRAPTPSAAAELISPNGPELQERIQAITKQLFSELEKTLNRNSQSTDYLAKRIKLQRPNQRLLDGIKKQHQLSLNLKHIIIQRLQTWRLQQINGELSLKGNSPLPLIQQQTERFKQIDQMLSQSISETLQKRFHQQLLLSKTLSSIGPQNTLDRGYAIVKHESSNEIIRNPKTIKEDEHLKIQVQHGSFKAIVKC